MSRQRVTRSELLAELESIVLADPKYGSVPLPALDWIPRSESLEASNWWVNLPATWPGSTPQQRRAVRAAIHEAQERFDIDWDRR